MMAASSHGSLIAALVVSLSASSNPAVARDDRRERQWKVEYEMGTERIKWHRKLDLTVNADALVLKSGKKALVTIPMGSLVHVIYDTVPHRPLDEIHAPTRTAWDHVHLALSTVAGAESAFVLGWLATLGPQAFVTFAVLFPFPTMELVENVTSMGKQWSRTNDRFVYIVWREEETTKDTLMRFDNQEECSELLAAIGDASGLLYTDLPAFRERVVQVLKTVPQWSVALEANEPIRVGGMWLRPGQYTLALVEGAEGQGQVFLFDGDGVRLKDLSALTPVAIGETGTDAAAPSVTYENGAGFTAISSIDIGAGRVLHFPAEPLPGEPRMVDYGGVPAYIFGAGRCVLDPVTLASYGGERAVQFPMLQSGFGRPEGYLYVTASRVAYDPVLTPRQGRSIDLPRAEVKNVACLRNALGGYRLEIGTKGREFVFRPLGHFPPTMSSSTSKELGEATRRYCELVLEAFDDFHAVEARLTPE